LDWKVVGKQPKAGEARVVCCACGAASGAVDLVVDAIFHRPTIWAELVVKVRARWCIEMRPWCQRRWVLNQLLRSARQQLYVTDSPSPTTLTVPTMQSVVASFSTSASDGARGCVWEEARHAAEGAIGTEGAGGGGGGGSGLATLSNSELLHVMVQWLLEESVAPRQDVSAVVEADDGEGEGDRLSPFGLLAGDDY
jgi:hypothetical protein